MANQGLRRGIDLYLYRNTGTFGVPTWTLVNNVRDMSLGIKRTKIDANYRGNGQFMAKVGGLIDCNPTFEMIYDQSDPSLVAFQAAFYATSPAGNQGELAFSDGVLPGVNVRYLRAIVSIFDISEKQDLDGIDLVSIDTAPTYNVNSPPTINSA